MESQRAAAQEERKQRVERVRAETTDTVTRNAKKSYVDERWDTADAMREKAEAWRAQRKAQELAYLESALAINASTSLEPAKAARAKAQEMKARASSLMRERKKQIKDQAVADGGSVVQAKSAIHDSIHGLKFVPEDEVRRHHRLAPTPSLRSQTPSPELRMFLALTRHTRVLRQIKSLGKTDSSRFKIFFAPRTPASTRRKAPYEVVTGGAEA